MRTKISFHRNEKNTSKVCLVKSSFGGLRIPVDLSSKDYTSLVSSIKVMTFRENHFQNT